MGVFYCADKINCTTISDAVQQKGPQGPLFSVRFDVCLLSGCEVDRPPNATVSPYGRQGPRHV